MVQHIIAFRRQYIIKIILIYEIQSIIFNEHVYNFTKCKKFAADNNFKIGRIDMTKNYYRFCQLEPSYLLQNKNTVLKTKIINTGIKLIVYYKK